MRAMREFWRTKRLARHVSGMRISTAVSVLSPTVDDDNETRGELVCGGSECKHGASNTTKR